ncbi:MAG: SixA phosphatase family protein [Flavisolibacter sp.]
MKTLILVRHAKSSWDQPGLSDMERALNEKGKADAPEMAKRLKEKGIKIDLFVSSPAKRARKTAKYFAEAFGVKKEEIKLVEDLYLATDSAFSSTVSSLDDECEAVALFSHNPGITEYASSLTNVRIEDMPTCAVFGVQAETSHWSEFQQAEKKFLFFDYPKNPLG